MLPRQLRPLCSRTTCLVSCCLRPFAQSFPTDACSHIATAVSMLLLDMLQAEDAKDTVKDTVNQSDADKAGDKAKGESNCISDLRSLLCV